MKKDSITKRIEKTTYDFPISITPPFPSKVMLELSNACQYRCIFCAHKTMRVSQKFISLNVAKIFLQEAYDNGTREVGINGCGEQFLHKDIAKCISYAKKIGYSYVYATSNGASPEARYIQSINEGLDSIKFSFNAVNAEEYSLIHGTSKNYFTRVKDKINRIAQYIYTKNFSTSMYISCVVSKKSQIILDKLKDIFPEYIDEIVLYEQGNQAGQFPGFAKNKDYICYMPFNFMRLDSSGKINICCVDFDGFLDIGIYQKNKLNELWNSDIYKEIRKNMMNHNMAGTLCNRCITGEDLEIKPLLFM